MDARRIAELEAKVARLELEKEALQDKLEAIKRRFFGRSSEKAAQPEQPQLFDEGEEAQASIVETPER